MPVAETIDTLGLTLPAEIAVRGNDPALLVRKLLLVAPAWQLGAMGPRAFDCWSMHQLVQYHLFGRHVVAVRLDEGAEIKDIRAAVVAHPANAQWQKHDDTPAHGDAIKMGHLSNPFHIGVYLAIDRGVVLHHTEVSGICCDNLAQLRARGYRNVTFHHWAGGDA